MWLLLGNLISKPPLATLVKIVISSKFFAQPFQSLPSMWYLCEMVPPLTLTSKIKSILLISAYHSAFLQESTDDPCYDTFGSDSVDPQSDDHNWDDQVGSFLFENDSYEFDGYALCWTHIITLHHNTIFSIWMEFQTTLVPRTRKTNHLQCTFQ